MDEAVITMRERRRENWHCCLFHTLNQFKGSLAFIIFGFRYLSIQLFKSEKTLIIKWVLKAFKNCKTRWHLKVHVCIEKKISILSPMQSETAYPYLMIKKCVMV